MASPFSLSPLPWADDALEPVISARTISFHYHKHHKAYVTALNGLVEGTPYAAMKLEEIVHKTHAGPKKIFNNAGQVWNHDFYWRSLSPKAAAPQGDLARAIERDFGSAAKLIEALAEAGKTQFGSGWAWLVLDAGKLRVVKTSNADLPLKHGQTALLTVDVWEHAYYIDYRNLRPKYVETFLASLVNWDFVAANLAAAK